MGANAAKLKKAMAGGEAEIKKSFDAYDKDKSGTLERKELQKFGEDCLKFTKKDLKGCCRIDLFRFY